MGCRLRQNDGSDRFQTAYKILWLFEWHFQIVAIENSRNKTFVLFAVTAPNVRSSWLLVRSSQSIVRSSFRPNVRSFFRQARPPSRKPKNQLFLVRRRRRGLAPSLAYKKTFYIRHLYPNIITFPHTLILYCFTCAHVFYVRARILRAAFIKCSLSFSLWNDNFCIS